MIEEKSATLLARRSGKLARQPGQLFVAQAEGAGLSHLGRVVDGIEENQAILARRNRPDRIRLEIAA
jgi:hypothetical protein